MTSENNHSESLSENKPENSIEKETPSEEIKVNFEEKYLRCLAEMENMRKRLLKEQKDFAKMAVERFVKSILEPLDNLENALSMSKDASPEIKNWAVGFEMIKQQFLDCLSINSIIPYEAKSGMFDPTIHEAVETICDDNHKPGTILKQFIKGYKIGEKVIRAAKVAVSCKSEPEKNQEDNEETTEQDNKN